MTIPLHQGTRVLPGKHSRDKGILKTLKKHFKDIKSIQQTLKAFTNLKDTYITSPVVLLLIYLYV